MSNQSTSASSNSLMANYARQPVSFVRGEGCWLFDSEDKRYLDGLCGISVTNLGHNHPAVTTAIQDQAEKLLHTSNLFQIEWQAKLADLLSQQSQLDQTGQSSDRVFFANSGAEANEAAVKLARLYAHSISNENSNNDNPLVVTFNGSFHGRTMGMIAATAGDKIKAGFEPILPGFLHLPYNDIAALEKAFAEHTNIAAVMLEPVQGEGGINIANIEFLNAIQRLCKNSANDNQSLIILDEVQSSNGRCGEYFAFKQFQKDGANIHPDIVTTAKGLGNGLPIGACIARETIASVFVPGKHGSTFGGNPLCCRAACAVVEQINQNKLCDRAILLGNKLAEYFRAELSQAEGFKEVRQKGLMLGIQLDRDCSELVSRGLNAGIVLNVTAGSVVRLLPPLIMSDAETDQLAEKTCDLIKTFLKESD